jgi:hypothetical protein
MPIDASQFLTYRFRPLRSVEDYRMREEFVPHRSESCRRAAMGTMGDGPTYGERATEGTRCLPVKLERAIGCMRLIAGRTKFAHSLKLSLR